MKHLVALVALCLTALASSPLAMQIATLPEQEPPNRAHSPNGEEERNSDPVWLASGEFHLEETDLRIPGPGYDFIWKRSYRARAATGSPMGHRWTHSYDISVEYTSQGLNNGLLLRDGNGRRSFYVDHGTTLTSAGRFNEFEYDHTGSFSGRPEPLLTWPDMTQWFFHKPGTINAYAGKIEKIVDRNGNETLFSYDSNGLLDEITDTRGEVIELDYVNGRITEVTDTAAGRVIEYEYYDGTTSDGSSGDLKSVRSPVVVGTSNGDNFPDGKTRTYKYNTGESPDELNHYITEVINGKGQTTIENTYEFVDASVDYYRVKSQEHGDGHFQYVYEDITPDTEENNDSVRVTIVNDRVGNVRHLYYNSGGALALYRFYTGRANPTQPTTLTTNRPTGKLRSSDPDYFEKRYLFNGGFNVSSEVFPNGDTVTYVYDESNSDPRARGNLLSKTRTPGPAGADQTQLVETWQYHATYNLKTLYTPPKGSSSATTYEYYGPSEAGGEPGDLKRVIYPDVTTGVWGGGTQTAEESYKYNSAGQIIEHVWPGGRRDVFTYTDGYLDTKRVDIDNFDLLWDYDYDDKGNLVAMTDPRGAVTEYEYNALNQVVREYAPRDAALSSSSPSYTDYYYDENNNLVKTEEQNLDEFDVAASNAVITNEFFYDVLDNLIEEHHEISQSGSTIESAVTRYELDANENCVLTEFGVHEVLVGGVPTDVALETVESVYDERDLLLHTIRAPGDTDQSTDTFTYDGNGNLVQQHHGVEDTSGDPRITNWEFDGFDRLWAIVDAEGNERQFQYDAHGNVVLETVVGEPLEGLAGSTAGNVTLAETTLGYDQRDRQITSSQAWFDRATGTLIGDGSRLTSIAYDADSNERYVTDDNGHVTETRYDTIQRIDEIVDAAGNSAVYSYDDASNVLSVTQTEVPLGPSGAGTPVVTVTASTYDFRDRRKSTTDADGETAYFAYDSRNNLVSTTDRRGNTTHTTYDGLDRVLTRTYALRTGGTGAGAIIGSSTTASEWDLASRLIAQIDGEGNRTEYEYDALGRQVKTTYADGTEQTQAYDVHDNLVTMIDANGTETSSGYDLLNRVLSRSINKATNVEGTLWETFSYDGLSALVAGEDDDSLVERSYDSLGNVRSEELTVNSGPTATTSFTHDGVGNILTTTYPGSRVITTGYDELNQLVQVDEGATTLAEYWWDAPKRLGSIDRANGTSTVYSYDTMRRIDNVQHENGSGMFSEFGFEWDEESNKIERFDARNSYTYSYTYDSLNRLVDSSSNNPILGDTSYELDDANNRETRTVGAVTGTYTLDDTTPSPADKQVNQYTEVPASGSVTHGMLHDQNGNLRHRTESGLTKNTMAYDYRNQMVSYSLPNGTKHVYRYDVLGRRVGKTLNSTAVTPNHFVYAYSGDEVIEERTASGVTRATYVLGAFLDEVLSMRRSGADSYYHADDQGSVLALTDAAGAVIERYDYTDFGRPVNGTTFGRFVASSVDNPYYFTGRRRDDETKWYYYRTRYFVPKWGRFTTRDTIGIWGDPANRGNGYTYLNNNPWSANDPYGEGFWDFVQTGLDVLGMVPIVGNAADLLNAGISVARGDTLGASLSLAASVPFVGQAVASTKLAKKTAGVVEAAGSALKKGGREGAESAAGAISKSADEVTLCGTNAGKSGTPGSTGRPSNGTPDPDAPKPKPDGDGANGTDNGSKGEPGKGETGADGNPCANSFAAGTLVLTLSGLRPIEGLEVGDLVWSLDPETGEAAWKPVVATFVRHAKLLMDLDLVEADGDAQELLVTSEHPFRTPDGWATVAELEVGDRVWARDGWATVASVFFTNRRETVYNFMVAEFHTYAVGEGVVWTHNECGDTGNNGNKKSDDDGFGGGGKPDVDDPKLRRYMDDFWKGQNNPNRVGNGSTADAIRQELKTGKPTGGRFHSQKGRELANGLRNWLRRNPSASPSDISAAQTTLADIVSALGGH